MDLFVQIAVVVQVAKLLMGFDNDSDIGWNKPVGSSSCLPST